MDSREQPCAAPKDVNFGQLRMSYVMATPEVATMPLAWVGRPDSILADIAEIGYRGIELQTRDPARLDRRAIAKSLERAGLVATGVSTGAIPSEDGLFMTSPDAAIRGRATERLIEVAEFAAELGTHMTIGSVRGYRKWAPDESTAMSWFESVLDSLLVRAEALGTKVVIEPQSRYASDFLNRIADTVAIIEAHGSPWLAIEADVYHMALEEYSIPAALVTAQASGRLAHVQISDSNRLAPGWGNVNWQDVFATLRALKYDRWISVEVSQIPDSKSAALQGFRLAAATYGGNAPNSRD
jgi:sugar phosphate isomerase/epimerase